MATTHNISLFVLPAELRLGIYKHLFDKCLVEGHVSDVAGLFLCCRVVHRELEADFMTRARPLLEAKYTWKSTKYGNEVLGMRVAPSLSAKTGKAELVIVLPKITDVYTMSDPGLKRAGRALIPACASTWSVLTLKLQTTGYNNGFHLHITRYILNSLFCGLNASSSGSFQVFGDVDRLVMNCNNAHIPFIPMVLHQLSLTFGNIRDYVKNVPPYHVAHEGWISRVEKGVDQGWQLAIDFDHDQHPVEGALWRLKVSDNSVIAKRLPVISEDESSNSLSETEFHYMNDRLAGFASLNDDTESDSDTEAEEQDHTDGEDEANSNPGAQEGADSVGEIVSANESGDEEEIDELKSDDYTEEIETKSNQST